MLSPSFRLLNVIIQLHFLSYNCFEILPTVIIEICDSIVIAALVAFEFGEAQPRDCNRSKLIELHKRWDS